MRSGITRPSAGTRASRASGIPHGSSSVRMSGRRHLRSFWSTSPQGGWRGWSGPGSAPSRWTSRPWTMSPGVPWCWWRAAAGMSASTSMISAPRAMPCWRSRRSMGRTRTSPRPSPSGRAACSQVCFTGTSSPSGGTWKRSSPRSAGPTTSSPWRAASGTMPSTWIMGG